MAGMRWSNSATGFSPDRDSESEDEREETEEDWRDELFVL